MTKIRWKAGAMWIVELAGSTHDAVVGNFGDLFRDALANLRAAPNGALDEVLSRRSGGTVGTAPSSLELKAIKISV